MKRDKCSERMTQDRKTSCCLYIKKEKKTGKEKKTTETRVFKVKSGDE
jgi:hypothetical protein